MGKYEKNLKVRRWLFDIRNLEIKESRWVNTTEGARSRSTDAYCRS
ncbi:hypothetical protein [Allocoleopsis franciscana]|uniref:Uncharacterized protein n=1 Tax=Allocoleopsis franciscana PCC 7113 TaxID=1173027 RepID=K9WLF8_9CYAN|nr:hypothetical protein [Allocoleopsis franciscana]AFZ20377.1 hypothetical protein Mic7113_4704 [Allocoleopsis franciscana PCC 7113]